MCMRPRECRFDSLSPYHVRHTSIECSKNIRYGTSAGDRWTFMSPTTLYSGVLGRICSADSFGFDPAPGAQKICECSTPSVQFKAPADFEVLNDVVLIADADNNAIRSFALECAECPAGSYSRLSGQTSCMLCPTHMTSPLNSTSESQCQCRPGYTKGPSGNDCTACTAGKYKVFTSLVLRKREEKERACLWTRHARTPTRSQSLSRLAPLDLESPMRQNHKTQQVQVQAHYLLTFDLFIYLPGTSSCSPHTHFAGTGPDTAHTWDTGSVGRRQVLRLSSRQVWHRDRRHGCITGLHSV